MTLSTAISQGTELLASTGTPEPRLTAELLLCHAVHCERVYLYAHPEQELREVEWLHYGRWLHERMQGKPLQYITKTQEFYGRPFKVSPDVLIPRPETELLIEVVLKRRPNAKRIVDVGTGSGAIAITLALELKTTVIATDISRAALKVAHANGAAQFLETNLLSSIADASVEVVVSNPPYVSIKDRETMQREVRDWEPHLALFAGEEGLDVYRSLIPEAKRVLKSGGLLALEIGQGQSKAVRELVSDWQNIEIANDLAGIPRTISCEKSPISMVVLKRVQLGPHHHPSLTKHTISDKNGMRQFPPFVELVIAAYPGDTDCSLFHICAEGPATDTWHQSVEEAMDQAEWELGVRPEEWIVPDRLETF